MTLGRVRTWVSSTFFLLQGIKLKNRGTVTLFKITLRYSWGLWPLSCPLKALKGLTQFITSSEIVGAGCGQGNSKAFAGLQLLASVAKACRLTLFWCLLLPGVFGSPYVCAYALVYSD